MLCRGRELALKRDNSRKILTNPGKRLRHDCSRERLGDYQALPILNIDATLSLITSITHKSTSSDSESAEGASGSEPRTLRSNQWRGQALSPGAVALRIASSIAWTLVNVTAIGTSPLLWE